VSSLGQYLEEDDPHYSFFLYVFLSHLIIRDHIKESVVRLRNAVNRVT
jgi:hypothetical protein